MTISVSTIYCDDIREEKNGKLIFIGVYSGDLVPERLPAKLSLCSWSRLEGVSSGKHDLVLRLNLPDGSFQDQGGQIDVDDKDDFVSIITSRMPIKADRLGIVRLDFIISGELVKGTPLRISSDD